MQKRAQTPTGHRRLRIACGALLALVASPALFEGGSAAQGAGPPSTHGAFVPHEVLVRFKDSATGGDRLRIRRRHRVDLREGLWTRRLQRLTVPRTVSVRAVARQLERDPYVAYAEPNFLYTKQAIPNDPSFGRQWGLHNPGGTINGVPTLAGADIDAPEAWDVTRGSSDVLVAVVDTGMRFDHPDLAGNARPMGNGAECEWPLHEPLEPRDDDGHGTHISGIIGAATDNGGGIAGVAPRVSLMPLRALGSDGSGSASSIAQAFICAAKRGAKVVNASFGGGSTSHVLAEAISQTPGVLYVAAAGNSLYNDDIDLPVHDLFPCSYTHPNVICVAATDQRDELAFFSNYGEISVDLAAPGVDILSTHPSRDVLFSDDFETELSSRWSTPQYELPWGRTTGRVRNGSYSLFTEIPLIPDVWSDVTAEMVQGLDLAGRTDCTAEFWADAPNAATAVEWRTDNWYWSGLGGASGPARNYRHYIDEHGAPNTRVRFRTSADRDPHPGGVAVDDLSVQCRARAPTADAYRHLSGTSQSTPFVTGVAALVYAKHPHATPAQVRNALIDGVDRLPLLEGKVVSGGRLNARRSLTVPLRSDLSVGAGTIRTVAGASDPTDPEHPYWPDGDYYGDGGPATAAALNHPDGIATFPDGGYLIADSANNRVRRVSPGGVISTVAGSGPIGVWGSFGGDGGPASLARLSQPREVAPTSDGGFLVLDRGNLRVRRVSAHGVITTVAGNGERGTYGDGGPAKDASLDFPDDIAALPDGGFLVAQTNAVRRVSPTGTITTVPGIPGGPDEIAPTSDGGFAYTAGNTIRRWHPDGTTTLLAGASWKGGFSGDFGPATAAWLDRPHGIVQTADGGFLFADTGNHRVRRVSPGGTITTVAGWHMEGFRGDGGPATQARLHAPVDVAATANGGVLISDMLNHRIRLVDSYFDTVGTPGPARPVPTPHPGADTEAPPGSEVGAGANPFGGGLRPEPGQGIAKAKPPVQLDVASGKSTRARLIRRGIRFTLTCPEPCEFYARLLGGKKLLGLRSGGLTAPGARTVTVKLTSRAKKGLRRGRRIRLTLALAVRGATGDLLLAKRIPLHLR